MKKKFKGLALNQLLEIQPPKLLLTKVEKGYIELSDEDKDKLINIVNDKKLEFIEKFQEQIVFQEFKDRAIKSLPHFMFLTSNYNLKTRQYTQLYRDIVNYQMDKYEEQLSQGIDYKPVYLDKKKNGSNIWN